VHFPVAKVHIARRGRGAPGAVKKMERSQPIEEREKSTKNSKITRKQSENALGGIDSKN